MRKNIFAIWVVLLASILTISFVGCGNDDNTSHNPYEVSIKSSTEALNYVKSSTYVKQEIADEFDLNSYLSVYYGDVSVEEIDESSWEVTIKGNVDGMGGTYGDTHVESRFTAIVKVSDGRGTSSIRVQKLY